MSNVSRLYSGLFPFLPRRLANFETTIHSTMPVRKPEPHVSMKTVSFQSPKLQARPDATVGADSVVEIAVLPWPQNLTPEVFRNLGSLSESGFTYMTVEKGECRG
jgi:hypothetical protein